MYVSLKRMKLGYDDTNTNISLGIYNDANSCMITAIYIDIFHMELLIPY